MPDNVKILQRLERPNTKVHMVLDTDAFNEIDDQYAISYALKKQDRLVVEAIYAAPFFNEHADSVKDGMERSYREVKKLLPLLDRQDMEQKVYRGSEDYLVDEYTPQISEAARDLVARANAIPEGDILYVAALGAITNIASAILIDPNIVEKIVLVWLGGNVHYWKDTKEFNMRQDIAAVRVIFDSGVPLVQIPCMGVASHLIVTGPELREHMSERSKIGKYLYDITCDIASRKEGKYWSRVIWDISVLMWLAGPSDCMTEHIAHSPIVSYDGNYSEDNTRHLIKIVDSIDRDLVFEEFFDILAAEE